MKSGNGKLKSFFIGRAKSIKYALKGFFLLLFSEHSIIAQTSVFVIVSILGFYVGISKQDWINLIIPMGMILSTEGMNTAVEKIADFVHEDFHPKIGFIKDIAAGAVTFSALTFFIVFLLTFIPYFI